MQNCRKSDVEIICVSTRSSQNRVLWDFWQNVEKRAETRRCFIVHTQLTVMPVSMCCTGTGATMAMGFALQVQFMFRPCSQLVYCLLFSLSIPAFLLRDPTHLGSGRVVAGVGPLVLRALVAAHAGGLCPLSSSGSGGGQDSILGSKPHLQVSSDAGLYATRYVSRLDITYTNLIMYAKF